MVLVNTVPVAAAIYRDDMHLDRGLSLGAARIIHGLQPWLTDEYQHDGLRTSNGAVLERLPALVNEHP
ncbi:hypothetical protein [Streptomyces sp. NPDC048516]|uniref:hypothetical protein n=1 Tax=Streptomyces sp. NPDC048516 TaxID=3365565 RepID=UPI00371160F3